MPVASKQYLALPASQPKGRLISPASLSLPLPLPLIFLLSISKDPPSPRETKVQPKKKRTDNPFHFPSHSLRFACSLSLFLPLFSFPIIPRQNHQTKPTLPQTHPLSPFWIERVLVSGAQFVFDNRNYRACWASSRSKPNLQKIK